MTKEQIKKRCELIERMITDKTGYSSKNLGMDIDYSQSIKYNPDGTREITGVRGLMFTFFFTIDTSSDYSHSHLSGMIKKLTEMNLKIKSFFNSYSFTSKLSVKTEPSEILYENLNAITFKGDVETLEVEFNIEIGTT